MFERCDHCSKRKASNACVFCDARLCPKCFALELCPECDVPRDERLRPRNGRPKRAVQRRISTVHANIEEGAERYTPTPHKYLRHFRVAIKR